MMSLMHIGFVILKSTAKPIMESAIEYYVTSLVKSKLGYSKHQIDHICDHGTVSDGNSYAAKVKGYYSPEETIAKLEASNTELAIQIKELAAQLHADTNEDDFLMVDLEDLVDKKAELKKNEDSDDEGLP